MSAIEEVTDRLDVLGYVVCLIDGNDDVETEDVHARRRYAERELAEVRARGERAALGCIVRCYEGGD